jgi:hypothetical protein
VAGGRFSPILSIGHAQRSVHRFLPINKIFSFVASVRELFVRQLYRAERFFPAVENCGGVCEEETSKEKHHKKR